MKSQKILEGDYQKALKNNQFVLFIRDDEDKKLISANFDIPSKQSD